MLSINIIRAKKGDEKIIYDIVHSTINKIYPNYYPEDVVTFFINHHSIKNIKNALNEETVLLIKYGEVNIGTGSVLKNEIRRMFILPDFQALGYGTQLLNQLESKIKSNGYTEVLLDSSLVAHSLYKKNGYLSIKYRKIITPKGQFLCYNQMLKKL